LLVLRDFQKINIRIIINIIIKILQMKLENNKMQIPRIIVLRLHVLSENLIK